MLQLISNLKRPFLFPAEVDLYYFCLLVVHVIPKVMLSGPCLCQSRNDRDLSVRKPPVRTFLYFFCKV